MFNRGTRGTKTALPCRALRRLRADAERPGAARAHPPRRREQGDARPAAARRALRQQRRARHRPRRERHRQGGGGPRAARQRPAARAPVRRGQRGRPASRPARIGAVRPRPRRLHGRRPPEGGPARGGRGRHPLPRRDRRDAALAAGEAPAGAAGRRGAPGRRRALVLGGRADHLRHPPRPADDGGGRRFPRGPLLPPPRAQPPSPAPARAARGHPPAGPAVPYAGGPAGGAEEDALTRG